MRERISLLAIRGDNNTISLPFEASGEHIPVHFVIFHQQNFWHYQLLPGIIASTSHRTESPPTIKLCDGYRPLTIAFCCCRFPFTTPFFYRSIATGGREWLGIRDRRRASGPVLFYKDSKTVAINRLNQIIGRAQF